MKRALYADSISKFLEAPDNEIFGVLAQNNEFSLELTQKDAWTAQIVILKKSLAPYTGLVLFEYSIPRMGRRIDVVAIIQNVVFVLEFKVGEKAFLPSAIDQVWDYSLDLKNFHEPSHNILIAPVLIATEAKDTPIGPTLTPHNDNLLYPIKTNSRQLSDVIRAVLQVSSAGAIDSANWSVGRYSPTPTIIEAAISLYGDHSVVELTRNDAAAINLSDTSNAISEIIREAKAKSTKAICFVTGVPGAGKTLVGLNVATENLKSDKAVSSVFLSGNGPLVAVLREALARDKVSREKLKGVKVKKGEAMSGVKTFIQNVHHFRDECLIDESRPPIDHVAIFDEAQRAWNLEQTANFMRRKKGKSDFAYSEPEFLISCLDRHNDWAVVVCLVGGGQEINTGEAGISEWIESISRSFPSWHVHISPNLTDSEYGAGEPLKLLESRQDLHFKNELHLAVSMRSFRAENLSLMVKNLLDLDVEGARLNYGSIRERYPIVLTRDLTKAKAWLRRQARGSERYGIVVSSQAQWLKPHAIDVKSPIDPVHWFLDGKEDVRSSYYLEDVATEFHVQGLELDWSCVTWDADMRHSNSGWQTFSFVGDRWNNIKKEERKRYLKNAYRVILTRARQGMAIVIPHGEKEDPTRNPEYYDSTFDYFSQIGFEIL